MKSALIKKFSAKKQKTASAVLYCDILGKCDCTSKPHELVKAVMDGFNAADEEGGQSKNSLRGYVFEYVIGEILILYGIKFLYHQAEVLHVPLANFDWLLYHPVRPVSISCKTSPRERWKQAAYEGMALKRVYPKAKNYLVLFKGPKDIEKTTTETPQTIDHCVMAGEPNFDKAIHDIAQTEYKKAESMLQILDSSVLIN